MPSYFVRLNIEAEDKWEEIDEHLFKHRKKALSGISPRYGEDYIIKYESGKVEIHLTTTEVKKLGMVSRLAGCPLTQLTDSYGRSGFCTTPEFIKITTGKKVTVYENKAYISPVLPNIPVLVPISTLPNKPNTTA